MVAGVRYRLPAGCTPSTCLGVPEVVVWSDDAVTPLPLLPGYSTVTAVGINAEGWVAGYAGDPTTTGARAVVWKPTGAGYVALNLGVLPGTSSSWAAGIDDQGRAVGWSTTGGLIPLGRMFGFPRGQCTAQAFNYVTAKLTVTDETGRTLPRAAVAARFLDDYYLDKPALGATNRNGAVTFVHTGRPASAPLPS
jgi:hypothetical protein